MLDHVFPVLICLTVSRLILALILRFQGRRWWCKCGRPTLWEGDVNSMHCSQHFADPYSFTHILHGLLFFAPLWMLLSRWIPFLWRLVISVVVEVIWEAVENSEAVVEKYRKETVSKGYIGDSVGNSIGDTLCCGFGFFLAHFLGFKGSIIYYIVTELMLLFWIRDNLTLNIIMLLHPIPAIKEWQAQGQAQAETEKIEAKENSELKNE